MLRRCSRLQRSQVQTWRPFSTPSAQVRRARDSSSALSPHVAQTGNAVASSMRTVSTRGTLSHGIFSTMRLKLSEPSTARLVLRQWHAEDRAPFAALNADPLVMAHFPGTLTQAGSDALMDRCAGQLEREGHGLWAVQARAEGDFAGFVGLSAPTWDAAFTACAEIGWRLARSAWVHGLASEAAVRVQKTAFVELNSTKWSPSRRPATCLHNR